MSADDALYDEIDGWCGCCGRETDASLWCALCRDHVSDDGPPWERTFYALHKRDCPSQAPTWRVIPDR